MWEEGQRGQGSESWTRADEDSSGGKEVWRALKDLRFYCWYDLQPLEGMEQGGDMWFPFLNRHSGCALGNELEEAEWRAVAAVHAKCGGALGQGGRCEGVKKWLDSDVFWKLILQGMLMNQKQGARKWEFTNSKMFGPISWKNRNATRIIFRFLNMGSSSRSPRFLPGWLLLRRFSSLNLNAGCAIN